MTPDLVLEISKHAILTVAFVSAPILISMLLVGVAVSLFQAMTQINESTLSFIPKVSVACLILLVGGHWMLSTLMHYSTTLIENIPHFIGIR